MLSADQITKANDLPIKTVPVEEWGGDVGLRRLPAEEAVALSEFADSEGAQEGLEAACRFLSRVLCDENGSRLFSDEERAVVVLSGRDQQVLMRLIDEAKAHNGLSEESREELAKNSSEPISDST